MHRTAATATSRVRGCTALQPQLYDRLFFSHVVFNKPKCSLVANACLFIWVERYPNHTTKEHAVYTHHFCCMVPWLCTRACSLVTRLVVCLGCCMHSVLESITGFYQYVPWLLGWLSVWAAACTASLNQLQAFTGNLPEIKSCMCVPWLCESAKK